MTHTVLIVEDGDEYLENLRRFVAGPRYVQAHHAEEALQILGQEPVDLLYLDMRFDRIDRTLLKGDHHQATEEHNGDPERAWRFLQNNQGLYVLQAVRAAGYTQLPVILAYDFSREERRWSYLCQGDPLLEWVPDAITGDEIAARMERLITASKGA